MLVYEWNDSLNMNLAMVGTYFGEHGRNWLERAYETYRNVGTELEAAYYDVGTYAYLQACPGSPAAELMEGPPQASAAGVP